MAQDDTKDFQGILSSNRHHAFLVLGDIEKNYAALRLLLRKKTVTGALESADVWTREYESVGIDDAREIKEVQNTKPNGERRFVLISLGSIQSEAQNSLLKLFEEPSSQTTFIVCARSSEILLPTLLSRFYIVKNTGEEADVKNAGKTAGKTEGESAAKKFLSSSIQERMSLIEPIVKEKDKMQAENFLNDLEQVLATMPGKNFKAENVLVFENIFSARRFLRSRSPSIKMILENLCGIAPVI